MRHAPGLRAQVSELYHRLLLWHKLVAQQTGGLALCSVRHRLNRDEARGWSTMLRNVADEIDSVIEGRGFILDDRGQRVVESSAAKRMRTDRQEARHVATPTPKLSSETMGKSEAVSRKVGGPRVVTRKSK